MATSDWGIREPAPGDRLGGLYELTQSIGKGGMGVVWRALDLHVASRHVAIKFLPAELRDHGEAIEQMKESFEKIHPLTHQHIGKAFGLLVDSRLGPYVVMDLVEGESLRKYATTYRKTRGAISVEHVVELLRPVAAALDYAHGESVVHRDVKPENILVRTSPRLWPTLIDFGLAAAVRTTMRSISRQSYDAPGTLPYMSSEQLRGKRPPAVDQYALAVVAYELLANSLPLDSDSNDGLIHEIHHGSPEPIARVDGLVNDALLRGLAKKPEDRFRTCLELIEALARRSPPSPPIQPVKAPLPPRPLVAPFDKATAQAGQESWARHLRAPVEFANDHGQRFRLIPPGEFLMGSSAAERERMLKLYPLLKAERMHYESQHRVRLTRPWYLSIHAVTVGQFSRFVSQTGYKTDAEREDGCLTWKNPGFAQTDSHPVVNVSWNDATAYASWLGKLLNCEYRLPSEAEWEFACRAGTTTAFWNGDDVEALTQVANIADATAKDRFKGHPNLIHQKSSDGFAFTSPVGQYPANPFGLHDMHGNVGEWCQDWYGPYPAGEVTDPAGPLDGSARVIRGGSFADRADFCRSAFGSWIFPTSRTYYLGFRLALSFVGVPG
jgi:formylglycine-generating enzyme required for sulfatase activity